MTPVISDNCVTDAEASAEETRTCVERSMGARANETSSAGGEIEIEQTNPISSQVMTETVVLDVAGWPPKPISKPIRHLRALSSDE